LTGRLRATTLELPTVLLKQEESMPRFLTDVRPLSRQATTAPLEFYREEFLKHQRCLRRQREFYSVDAIQSAENALKNILSRLDQLCRQRNADELVSRLLRQFDVVTGLSAWSDPKQTH
jgi:hypothetical protein